MSIIQIITTVVLASVATAQIVVPQAASDTFPACALSCTPLLTAQSACVPPAAPATDQATYVSCFCQSGYLTTLHSSPDGTCDQWCTVETDRQELMSWYNNLCAAGVATTVSSTSAVSGPQTTIVYITSTSAPAITASPTDSSTPATSSSGNGSWYDVFGNDLDISLILLSRIGTHWKWILMVAILLIGLGALAFFAVWLKRRHKRKAEEKQAVRSGFPIEREKAGSRASTANLESLFGPAQHMAATRGWEYPDENDGAAAAALAGEKRRSTRASRRHSSRKGKETGAADVIHEMSTDRSRSRRRLEHEKERERNKEVERGLRGIKGKDIEKS